MRRTAGSKMANAKNWAEQAGMFPNGWGPGPGATLITDRERDVAAYERMKAAKPLKPPHLRPREATSDGNTGGALSCVQSSKPDTRAREGAT